MKVLLVNGSPHKSGCTAKALEIIAQTLAVEGVTSDTLWLGIEPLAGCIGCGACRKTGKCFRNDIVNEAAVTAKAADGYIFGSPVHYAAPTGIIESFMQRLFYSAGKDFAHKPAAAIVSARRSGTTAAFEQLNKFFTINQMPVVTSTYWNAVHGSNAEEVLKDEEGVHTMRNLARNMAWLIKCIKAGRDNGVDAPTNPKIYTNFVR